MNCALNDKASVKNVIVRLRKCVEELSQIADVMAKQTPAASAIDAEELERRVGDDARRVVEMLATFGINAKVEKVHQGPTFNKIELSLPPGCRYSSVNDIADNLQGALKKQFIRIEDPIPNADTVGIEYDRSDPEPVTYGETTLPELARLDALCNRPKLPVVVGKDVDRGTVSFDLAAMPHLFIGGATGQGKTMFIHGLINGLITSRSPEEVRLILFDPKCVEFVAYANLPHLVVPVVNRNSKMVFALQWTLAEVEKRLKMFASVRVRNIQDFNNREITADEQFKGIPKTVPYIVLVFDELADFMLSCGKEVDSDIARLTVKARAAGIHLVMATQNYDSGVYTNTIDSCITGRVAFKTQTHTDSCIVLDAFGAGLLIGKGDCLYRDGEGVIRRVQAPFISDDEIAANVERAIARYSAKEYDLNTDVAGSQVDSGSDMPCSARPMKTNHTSILEYAKSKYPGLPVLHCTANGCDAYGVKKDDNTFFILTGSSISPDADGSDDWYVNFRNDLIRWGYIADGVLTRDINANTPENAAKNVTGRADVSADLWTEA